jgi:hypothetical protein
MTGHESRQIAWWGIGLAAGLGVAGATLALVYGMNGSPVSLAGVGLVLVGLLVANFAVLSVRVTASEVLIAFGPGWVRRRIPLADVREVTVAHSPWYWGWGLRWTPRGWLWRASGLDAVWLRLASGREAGFGASDPERVAAAIRARTTAG